MNSTIKDVTARIKARSQKSRRAYLNAVSENFRDDGPRRTRLSEGNVAHASAGCPLHEKMELLGANWPNIGIVTAYNDMLSAHQPFERFPSIIKHAARRNGAVAQVAGGVPAMCDGVTQGRDGMELSLFSRDTIAMSTAIALSHDMFDAAIHLGVCDKIVPGLLIGALRFGHIPQIFAPAGPMPSGLPNPEKARVRQEFAEGKVGRDALLKAEAASYHAPGTCTFYGTANTNQMLMEIMGMQLPGSSFVHPNTPLRDAITAQTTRRAVQISSISENFTPAAHVIDEKAIVNGIVGLMATGGSTNLTIHMSAMARAAGIIINWDDLADISHAVPLICKMYPNGIMDVNHFHAAGGMAYLIAELLSADLVHNDVTTVAGGEGLSEYTREPVRNQHAEEDTVLFRKGPTESLDKDILTTIKTPFRPDGGLRLLEGNLGRVLRFQGPRANGMPELHKLTPILGSLQDKGFKVGLVTDGRMSGASGKVPAAIHMHPEAMLGGELAKVRTGDMISLDPASGAVNVTAKDDWTARDPAPYPPQPQLSALGMNMFGPMRAVCTDSEAGASFLGDLAFGEDNA